MNEAVENKEPVQAQLSLQDIATSVQIIDICSRRGGFEGTELEAVGALRGRLVLFLEANKASGEQAPDGAVPETEVEEPSVNGADDSDS